MDMFGLLEGIGPLTKNKPQIICTRFIEKVSQMDGTQLAHFLADYSIEVLGFNLVLTFKIPFRPNSIKEFLCKSKRERQGMILISSSGKATEEEKSRLANAIRQVLVETGSEESRRPQPGSTEHTQNQVEGSHEQGPAP